MKRNSTVPKVVNLFTTVSYIIYKQHISQIFDIPHGVIFQYYAFDKIATRRMVIAMILLFFIFLNLHRLLLDSTNQGSIDNTVKIYLVKPACLGEHVHETNTNDSAILF